MSRIMNSAKDLGCLIMQHAEDFELCEEWYDKFWNNCF